MERREVGLIPADDHTHLVVSRLRGLFAMCGAGRIVQRVPGYFDAGDPQACPDCARQLTGSHARSA